MTDKKDNTNLTLAKGGRRLPRAGKAAADNCQRVASLPA